MNLPTIAFHLPKSSTFNTDTSDFSPAKMARSGKRRRPAKNNGSAKKTDPAMEAPPAMINADLFQNPYPDTRPSHEAVLKSSRALFAPPIIASDQPFSKGIPNGSSDSKNSPDPKSSIPYTILTTPIPSTPPPWDFPNPTLNSLGRCFNHIANYNIRAYQKRYVPLPLGATNDYTLSIRLQDPQSLNVPIVIPWPQDLRWVFSVTRLWYAASISTLRTVALGRILYREQKTSWMAVMEIQHGNLYALRSDRIKDPKMDWRSKELDWAITSNEVTPEGDDDEGSTKEAGVAIPEFDDRLWKAVWIGNAGFLEEKNFVGGMANAGFQALMIERWDFTWLRSWRDVRGF